MQRCSGHVAPRGSTVALSFGTAAQQQQQLANHDSWTAAVRLPRQLSDGRLAARLRTATLAATFGCRSKRDALTCSISNRAS